MARVLSQKHLQLYQKGGKFYKLFSVIQEDPELSFEIRTQNTVCIYFNREKLLEIKRNDKKNKETITPFSEGMLRLFSDKEVDRIKLIRSSIVDPNTIRHKNDIKKYFNNAKDVAYKYKRHAEYAIQQSISLGSRSFPTDIEDDLVVIDMEWRYGHIRTRLDLVAIDPRPNGKGENDIYLVEVKHTLVSSKGDSGIQAHVDKTNAIICSAKACRALLEDVTSIIDQKLALGLLTGPRPTLKLAQKPKMMFFLSYRNTDERIELEKKIQDLKIPTGMEKPIVKYHDYTIKLSK